jgi:putative transposase
MARPLRPDLHGAWYHVINRGADRQDVFSTDSDFLRFETLLGKAVAEFGIEIHAYSLMSTHFHSLVHCPEGNLSPAVQMVQAEYAGAYNHHHERTGPLFEGRFRSILCEDVEQRHLTGRYVHRNPLDIVPAAVLPAYRWSSLSAHLGRTATPPWLTTHELNAQFQDGPTYLGYVTERHPSDKQADRLGIGPSVSSLAALELLIARRCGVTVDSMRVHRRRRPNDARLLAITLAVELRITGAERLAERYALLNAASVRATARRGRVRLADDPIFAALRGQILDRPHSLSYVGSDPT